MKGFKYHAVQRSHTDRPQRAMLYFATIIFWALYKHKVPRRWR